MHATCSERVRTSQHSCGRTQDLGDVLLQREVADGQTAERRLHQTVDFHVVRLDATCQLEPAARKNMKNIIELNTLV